MEGICLRIIRHAWMVVVVIGPHTAAHTTAGVILLRVKQIDDDVCISVPELFFCLLDLLGFNVQETSPRAFHSRTKLKSPSTTMWEKLIPSGT